MSALKTFLLGFGAVIALTLIMSARALADDCSGKEDCESSTAASALATGIGVAVGVGALGLGFGQGSTAGAGPEKYASPATASSSGQAVGRGCSVLLAGLLFPLYMVGRAVKAVIATLRNISRPSP